MHTEHKQPGLLRLMQLVSPSLPIGAYSFSQGLESAVERKFVHDEATATDWLRGILLHSLSGIDAPILSRMFDAWKENDNLKIAYWNRFLLATRETRELREQEIHLGLALGKVLDGLHLMWTGTWSVQEKPSFAAAFSFAAVHLQISKHDAISGYLWSWLENQVIASMKLVPLGQLAGQRMLFDLAALIPSCVENALSLNDDEIGGSLQLLSIVSSAHETQYSRLFRS